MAGATRLRHAQWHGVSTLVLEAVREMAPQALAGASRCVNNAEMTLMLWAIVNPKHGESSRKHHVFLVFYDERAQRFPVPARRAHEVTYFYFCINVCLNGSLTIGVSPYKHDSAVPIRNP